MSHAEFRQEAEEQEEHGIYIAIPPPLVSPLSLQLDSSRNSSSHHLPTPTSSQSYTQWAIDGHFRQTPSGSVGSSQYQQMEDSTSRAPDAFFIAPTSSTHAAMVTPVSPPPISLPAQLLNRLYPFSTMAIPSTDVSSSSVQAIRIGSANPPFSGLSGSSHGSSNNNSNFSNLSRSHLSYMTTSGGVLTGTHDLSSLNNNAQVESTRSAAAAVIANTLIHSRDIRAPPRGSSPYIPSSLSMLFSDPEITQVQEEIARATVPAATDNTTSQVQQRNQLDSRHTLSSEAEQDLRANIDRAGMEQLIDDMDHQGRQGFLLQTETTGAIDEDLDYGYEVVQDHEYSGTFQQRVFRDDYLAPHEPTSSSPLFPSPLTTLGRFGPATIQADALEQQQAATVGRIWQDYGTMGNAHLLQSQSRLQPQQPQQQQQQQQQQQPTLTPPMNQSHAAYYHAVSNHFYSSNEESQPESTNSGTTCAPAGHYAVPEAGRWRRPRGRGRSHQSYASAGSSSSWSRRRFDGNGGSEDHWLWGVLFSVVGCWVCCEGPAAACCSNCCV